MNEEDVINEYKLTGKLHPRFLPFNTYDLVEVGYPVPNRSEMVARWYGGTNKDGILLPSNGEYCKTEDMLGLLDSTIKRALDAFREIIVNNLGYPLNIKNSEFNTLMEQFTAKVSNISNG